MIGIMIALPPLAAKLVFVLNEGKVTATQIANDCGVTVQAVNGWKKTGRIAKHHIPVLAELSGHDVAWWLTGLRPLPGEKPSGWDAETRRFAAEFMALSKKERAKFRALLLLARDGVSDSEVEKRMPVTTKAVRSASKD